MADLQHITDGPSSWGLIIDALARRSRDGSEITFEMEDGAQPQYAVHITCLKSDWHLFKPRADLRMEELERAHAQSGEARWPETWWFEGHAVNFRSLPIWGIYNTQTRKGVLMSKYVGA